MSSKFKNQPGFLVVWMQTEGKGDVTEEEFHEWYDNEHIPLRTSTLPTFQTAARFRSLPLSIPSNTSSSTSGGVDQPKWVAAYTISNNEVFGRDEYTKLREKRSEREGKLVVRLDTLDRRIYAKSETSTSPDPTPLTPTPTLLLLNAFSPSTSSSPSNPTSSPNSTLEEFNAVLVSAEKRYATIEGFERVRRYELVERVLSGVGVGEGEKKRDRGSVLEVVEFTIPSPSTQTHTNLLASPPLQSLLQWYAEALKPLAAVVDFRAYEQFKVHRAEAALREMEGEGK